MSSIKMTDVKYGNTCCQKDRCKMTDVKDKVPKRQMSNAKVTDVKCQNDRCNIDIRKILKLQM